MSDERGMLNTQGGRSGCAFRGPGDTLAGLHPPGQPTPTASASPAPEWTPTLNTRRKFLRWMAGAALAGMLGLRLERDLPTLSPPEEFPYWTNAWGGAAHDPVVDLQELAMAVMSSFGPTTRRMVMRPDVAKQLGIEWED